MKSAPFAILLALLLLLAPATTAEPETDHATHDHPVADGIKHGVESTVHTLEHDGGDAHADGHEKTGLISPKIAEMIWTIVVFVIFFVVLSTVVWPKILAALNGREEKQRTDLISAETAAKEAQATLEQYTTQLAEARKESQTIVAEAREQAQRAANADKAQIEGEIAQLRDNAKREIAAAKQEALADVYAQVATLSTDVARKILQREINPADQQSLVNESIEQFKAKASTN